MGEYVDEVAPSLPTSTSLTHSLTHSPSGGEKSQILSSCALSNIHYVICGTIGARFVGEIEQADELYAYSDAISIILSTVRDEQGRQGQG